MSNDQPERQQRSSLGVWIAVAVVSLPILYVLGLGPAVWLLEHGYFENVILIVYSPLDSLHTHVHDTPIGDALSWYVDLWR